MNIVELNKDIRVELLERIVPFWQHQTIDRDNGGFVGRITGTGDYIWQSDKAVILNTRILWSFSALGRHFNEHSYTEIAQMAYEYIKDKFLDHEFGGVYWSVNYKGRPVLTKKQTFAQASAINALSEFYKLTGDKKVLSDAIEIFNLIEVHSFRKKTGGYTEAFTREWGFLEDVRLSSRDLNTNLTTNTHLHILEAYANLASVWRNDKLTTQLHYLLNLFIDHVIDPYSSHLRMFFDGNWRAISSEISFGHDIESSWTICRAADVLDFSPLQSDVQAIALRMVDATLRSGLNAKGGLLYEKVANVVDDDAHWWSQAEAMTGFLNAYQISRDEKYLAAAIKVWKFIKEFIRDHDMGEWHFKVSSNGEPSLDYDKVGPWKAPFHTVRAGIEILERTKTLAFTGSVE